MQYTRKCEKSEGSSGNVSGPQCYHIFGGIMMYIRHEWKKKPSIVQGSFSASKQKKLLRPNRSNYCYLCTFRYKLVIYSPCVHPVINGALVCLAEPITKERKIKTKNVGDRLFPSASNLGQRAGLWIEPCCEGYYKIRGDQ